jgi:para-nitrobenzyl esterase
MVQQRYGDMAAEYAQLYPVSTMKDIKTATAESGQDRNRVSMFLWASARVKAHKEPVYTYFFDRGIPWPQHPEFGAFHTGEIPYFFENLKALDRPWEKKDFTLADNVSTYLVNFASNGDPNGAGVAKWPAVDPGQPQTMELNVPGGPMALASRAKVEFWTKYFNSPISRNAPPF